MIFITVFHFLLSNFSRVLIQRITVVDTQTALTIIALAADHPLNVFYVKRF